MIQRNDTVLFQGDSITDAGRDRAVLEPNVPEGLGGGYVRDVSAMLLAEHGPDGVSIFNRGVGGDRVHELEARWEDDCLNLYPTVLSVMIGINDVWHGLNDPSRGVSADVFAAKLSALLSQARAALPELRLIVLAEPFVLPCGPGAELPFEPEVTNRRRIVRELAEGLRDGGDIVFVPYQDAFNRALDRGIAPEHLAHDGVHPTMAGHMLMARAWWDAVLRSD